MRFASLPMYNFPELADAYARFWADLKKRLVEKGLDVSDIAFDGGRAPVPDGIGPEIFFSQICGYPLFKVFRDQGKMLATPCYALPGCEGSSHRAFFVVRADEPETQLAGMQGRVFGCNSLLSNSGMNLPRLSLARLGARAPFFSKVVMTHGHVQSLDRLHAGEIDLCSIDCVTWGFFQKLRPSAAARYRILDETVSSPSLPFVTSSMMPPQSAALLAEALHAFFADPTTNGLRSTLALSGVADVDEKAYEMLASYEREAAALGYPEIA